MFLSTEILLKQFAIINFYSQLNVILFVMLQLEWYSEIKDPHKLFS